MGRNRDDDYQAYEDDDSVGGEHEDEYAELDLIEGSEAAAPENYALPHHYSEEHEAGSPGMMDKLKEKTSQWKEKGSELKQKAGTSMQNIKERTAEKTSALRMRASEKGNQLKEKARYGYETSRETFSRAADEQPLAVGLGFLAIGLVAGMLLPSTRKEDELVGPTRDRIVTRTREAAEDAVNRLLTG